MNKHTRHYNPYIHWYFYNTHGQALITLLFFIIVSTTITSAAILVLIANSLSTGKIEGGSLAYITAESGAENGIMRLLRDPTYTGESNLSVGTGHVDITVTGSGPYTILATGTNGNFIRKIQVQLGYTNNVLRILSWKEIF